MNTAVITVKIDPKLKKDAQKMADEFGVSLSALIHALLKNVVRTKTLILSADPKIFSMQMKAIINEANLLEIKS